MNKRMIGFITGKILILEAGLMVLPLIISFLYNENTKYKIAYGSVILLLLAIGFLLHLQLLLENTPAYRIYKDLGFSISSEISYYKKFIQ